MAEELTKEELDECWKCSKPRSEHKKVAGGIHYWSTEERIDLRHVYVSLKQMRDGDCNAREKFLIDSAANGVPVVNAELNWALIQQSTRAFKRAWRPRSKS